MNYRIKPVEELTMRDDYLFNALMKDEEICKGVVERLLGIPVREVKLLEVQKELSSFYDNKGIRMDVYLRDTDKDTFCDLKTLVAHGCALHKI